MNLCIFLKKSAHPKIIPHHIKISKELSEGGALKTSNIYKIIYVKKSKIND